MLSCRDVANEADLLLAGELSWRRRMAFRVHLVICNHCRRYVRQLKYLVRAIPFMHRKASSQEVSAVMDHIHSRKE